MIKNCLFETDRNVWHGMLQWQAVHDKHQLFRLLLGAASSPQMLELAQLLLLHLGIQ